MLRPRLFTVLLSPLLLAAAWAQPGAPAASGPVFDWTTTAAYGGAADISEGTRPLGEIEHQSFRFEGIRNLPLDAGAGYGVGLAGSWLSFTGSRADVPDNLGSVALKLAYSRPLNTQWTLFVDAEPGFYSDFDDLGGDDVNFPLGIRALYASSRTLQWAVAVFVNPRSPNPVIGGIGARWQFAPDWTLLLFLPDPKVEYALSSTVQLFAGGRLRGGTFRVAEDFGRQRGRPELDNQWIDYREITGEVGARWELQPGLHLTASAGWMFDRRFEYERRDLLLNGDGAPTFQLSLTGRW